MKRQILLTALLAFASACTTANAPSANNTTVNTNTNANTSASPATNSSAAAFNEQDLTAKERQIWDAIRAKNFDAFAAFLADDQLEVGSDAVYDKAGSVKDVSGLELTDYTLSDVKVVKLDADAGVVTYTVNIKGKYQGQDIPEPFQTQRHSTAWVNRDGKWLAVYHQGSTINNESAPPSNSNRATASPAASPAAATGSSAAAITTSADAIANEKQVWEAFKARNFDGFASILAEDFTDVEASGIYNKQASVEGLRHEPDLDKAALSDFREVKLDDDASLVTYMVSMPGGGGRAPLKMRHSSIWVNRGGRWLAVFHQGTNVMEMQKK